jgi:hypothetical protein
VVRAACEFREANLSPSDALAILEPFFGEVRNVFVEYGYRRCADTQLEVDGEAHDTPRHFAGCRDDGLIIVAAPQMADLPVDNVVAIFAHEFGHACDFLYPTRFQLAGDELVIHSGEWERPREPTADMDAKASRAVMTQWKDRTDDDIEQLADAVAEAVLGKPIGYAGPCLIQTLQAGVRRPSTLR